MIKRFRSTSFGFQCGEEKVQDAQLLSDRFLGVLQLAARILFQVCVHRAGVHGSGGVKSQSGCAVIVRLCDAV